MNKLRMIKIYQLLGKVHPIEEYIISFFKDSHQEISSKYIYFKKRDNIFIIYKILDDSYFIEYWNIWYYISSTYNIKHDDEVKAILEYILEKHLNKNIKITSWF